ncbi:MAG TPA: type III-B CRISPR module RAMP protein Cmr1 [Clostridiales bacterium]|nr:type III-B CRISPR module RAMP protein Cmr1 [Clostridiales bacterium]
MDVEITMETITPVWTGGAFQQCESLKPQSILGSLRFWLEVLCYAKGKLDKDPRREKLDQEKFLEQVNQFLEKEELSLVDAKRRALEELGISIPSQVFGCNGWEGFVKIKKLKEEPEKFQDKEESEELLDENNKSLSKEKLGSPFWGKCKIFLEIADEEVWKNIICPLLNFIEKYGFIGGKNRLGYGRVKFTFKLNNNPSECNSSKYDGFKLFNDKDTFDNIIKEKDEPVDLISNDLINERKIGLYKLQENIEKENILDIIQELLIKKKRLRAECKKKCNLDEIHYIFGHKNLKVKDKYSKYKDLQGPNATKIIPWINRVEQNQYEYGFISLVLLQDFPKR